MACYFSQTTFQELGLPALWPSRLHLCFLGRPEVGLLTAVEKNTNYSASITFLINANVLVKLARYVLLNATITILAYALIINSPILTSIGTASAVFLHATKSSAS